MSTRLLVTRREDVLLFTLDSFDGYPKLTRKVLAALEQELAALAFEKATSGAVVTGSETAFAAGADIAELVRLTPAEAHEFSRQGQAIFRLIQRSAKPVITAVRGYCMGGGLDLALACHERIATADAVFAHPGGALGILTGWGGTQGLPRLIGRARALELLATGERLDAQAALDCGLVRKIVPTEHLLDMAIARVREIAEDRRGRQNSGD